MLPGCKNRRVPNPEVDLPVAEVWPYGDPRSRLALGVRLASGAVVSGVLGYLFGWLALLLVVPASAVAWVWPRYSRDPRLVLTERYVEVHRRGKVSRLALAAVRRVTTDWVPYTDGDVLIAGSKVTIRCPINGATELWILELGTRLDPFRGAVRVSDTAGRLLGWTLEQRDRA